MSEADPRNQNALYVHHLEAGVEVLESCVLDHQDRELVGRLAIRLFKLAQKKEKP